MTKQLDSDTLQVALQQIEDVRAKLEATSYELRQTLDDVRRGGKIGEYELGQTLLIAQINLTAKLLGIENE